jgi:hypothetical protein
MMKPVEHGHGVATPSLAIGSLDMFQRNNQEDTTNRTGSADGGYRYISPTGETSFHRPMPDRRRPMRVLLKELKKGLNKSPEGRREYSTIAHKPAGL